MRAKFNVCMAMNVSMLDFWVVTSYGLLGRYKRSLKIEALCSSETLVAICKSTPGHKGAFCKKRMNWAHRGLIYLSVCMFKLENYCMDFTKHGTNRTHQFLLFFLSPAIDNNSMADLLICEEGLKCCLLIFERETMYGNRALKNVQLLLRSFFAECETT